MLFRTLLVWVLGLPITLFAFVFVLLALLIDKKGNYIHSIGAIWGRAILFLGGVRVKICGAGNIPKDTPLVFLSNHRGAFDIPALQGYLPHQYRWVAKKSLFKIPVIGWTMSFAGYVGIERESGRKAFKSMVEAANKIKNGTSVLIFPEGTRSDIEGLLPFKRGAFLLAAKAGVPIIPIGIKGTKDILKRGSFFINPADVTIAIGAPIATQGFVDTELCERTKEAIEGLLSAAV